MRVLIGENAVKQNTDYFITYIYFYFHFISFILYIYQQLLRQLAAGSWRPFGSAAQVGPVDCLVVSHFVILILSEAEISLNIDL